LCTTSWERKLEETAFEIDGKLTLNRSMLTTPR
jgi:hypothetical protein